MKNRQQGIVLPVVLVILLIMSVLGIALIGRMTFDARAEKISEDQMQAHYLARSGILIAKKYLLEQEKKSLLSVDGIHYYLYGDLYPDSATAFTNITDGTVANNHNTVVKYNVVSKSPSATVINLTATGTVNGHKDTITSTYNLSKGPTVVEAEDSAADKINNNTPLTIPDPWADGIPGEDGDIVVDSVEINFTDDDGDVNQSDAHKGLYSPSKESPLSTIVYKDTLTIDFHQNVGFLHSITMFFAKGHGSANTSIRSLEVTKGAKLSLYSNFFGFYGNLFIDYDNKKSHVRLYTYLSDPRNTTYESTLTGDKIVGGDPTKVYGLVYFEDGVTLLPKHGSATEAKAKDNNILRGYYFFPNGVDLATNSNLLSPAGPTEIDGALLSNLQIGTTFQFTEVGAGSEMEGSITYN